MNKINIYELARVSNIGVNTNEEVIYREEIQKVMDFIGEYEKPHDSLKNDRKIEFDDLREDIPEESLTLEEALMNTYKKKYSYFQVKEFVEQ